MIAIVEVHTLVVLRKGGLSQADSISSVLRKVVTPFTILLQVIVLILDVISIVYGDPDQEYKNIYWARPIIDLICFIYLVSVSIVLGYLSCHLESTSQEFLGRQATLFTSPQPNHRILVHEVHSPSHNATSKSSAASALSISAPHELATTDALMVTVANSPNSTVRSVTPTPKSQQQLSQLPSAHTQPQVHPLQVAMRRVRRFTRSVAVITVITGAALFAAAIRNLSNRHVEYATRNHYVTNGQPVSYIQFVAFAVVLMFVRPATPQVAPSN